jgi:hypothetical protein
MKDLEPLALEHGEQELVCLSIMARGEDMLAHGVWEAPIKRMAMRGWTVKVGNGYRITNAGKAYLTTQEADLPDGMLTPFAPKPAPWIVEVFDQGEKTNVVVLQHDPLAVSGYAAARRLSFQPIAHERKQDASLTCLNLPTADVTAFLQAVLDAAWARWSRPCARHHRKPAPVARSPG